MDALLNVRRFGPADGQPVVLLHGLGGSWRVFRHVIAGLLPEHSVLAIDLPGFGESPRLGRNWSARAAATMVDDTLEQLGVDAATIVGHSLGGAVALRVGLDHPARASGLVAIAPAGLSGGPQRGVPAHVRVWHPPWRAFQRSAAPALAVSARLRRHAVGRLTADAQRVRPADAVELARWSGRAQDTPHARAHIRGVSLLPELARLDLPVTVVWGVQDPLIPVAAASLLEAHLADATVELLEACGHLPPLEQPERLVAIIRTASGALAAV